MRSLHPLLHALLHLFPLGVALEHKGAEGGLPFLAAIAPVPVLHHESHQPGVFLVRGELAHLSQLELRKQRRTACCQGLSTLPNAPTFDLTGNIIGTYAQSCNLSLGVNQSSGR